MRVLTYNLHGWRGGDGRIDIPRLARIIRASGADLVGLNEVHHPLAAPGEEQPALEALAAALGMQAAFGVALTPELAFALPADYGNALLTRYPLLAHAGHHLPPVEGHEPRGLLEVRVLLPDGRTPLTVYVTHLDHKSERARMTQLAGLLSWTVRDRDRSHLLLGDFNAVAPGDYGDRPHELEALAESQRTRHFMADGQQVIPRLLRARYVDSGAVFDAGPTHPVPQPQVRIDYIFAAGPLAASLRSCGPWRTEDTDLASDHLPVLAEFDLDAPS